MTDSVSPRRKETLEALQTHWLSLSKLKTAILANDELGLAVSMSEMETTAITLSECLHEFLLTIRGVRTIRQKIEEETGCDLSPLAVSRDLRLRALHESMLRATNDEERQAAKGILNAYVRREYPREQ